MNLDLAALFPDLEALITPDGRWNALQDWLSKNPEYGERVKRWSGESVDRVFIEICLMATERYGAIAGMILGYPTTQSKLKRWIEILQACYRERAGEYKAEYTSGWIEPMNDQRPSAHKSIHDYQQQLKAKKRRHKK